MDPTNDKALFDNTDKPGTDELQKESLAFSSDSLQPILSGALDLPGSSSSSNSRKPSYDSRESKSISECSFPSGSPCESPLLDLKPIGMTTPFSSTCTMESDSGQTLNPSDDLLGYDPFQSEKEFIDYLMSLPSSKTETTTTLPSSQQSPLPKQSTFTSKERTSSRSKTPASTGHQGPKIGLDHLENLCKLMEQLGELREQNFKLQKRVQYLEEVRCLNEMRRDLKEALDNVIFEPSNAKKTSGQDNTLRSLENSTDALCSKTASNPPLSLYNSTTTTTTTTTTDLKEREAKRGKNSYKMRKAIKQQRGRSQSMGEDEMYGRQAVSGNQKSKVSKWTKVKEALKWERVQVDHRNGNTGNSALETRNSLCLDSDIGNTGNQPALMISKASVTLSPAKPDKRTHSSTNKYHEESTPQQQKSHKQLQGALNTNEPSREVVLRSPDHKDEFRHRYLFPEHYLDTSSDDGTMDILKTTDTEGKRRSMCVPHEFDILDIGSMRRQSSPTKIQVSRELILDDEQGLKERKGRTLERDSEHRGYVRYSQSEKECKKLSKGAWGKVKNIIQTRKDSLKRKHRKSGSEADFKNQNEADFSSFEYLEVEDETWSAASSENQTSYNRPGQEDITDFSKQMVSDPTQIKSKHSSSSSNYGGDDNLLDGQQEKSKMKKNKIQNLMIQVAPEDTALPDERAKGLHASPTPGSNALPGGSPNSQRKSKWTKVKNVFLKRDADMDLACQRPQSVPASPTNLTSFSYDDLGLFEEYLLDTKMWAERKEKGSVDFDSCDILNAVGSERLDSESIPMSSETKKNLEELQRNITQDFSKKMQEWEKLKMTAPKQFQNTAQQGSSQLSSQQLQQQQQQHQQQQQQQFQQQSPKLDRKGSSQKIRKGKPEKSKEKVDREVKGSKQREKELQWLEKQLQKVEREKQRLAKERQKYLEREARLEKMKETMMKPKTNEILIRTSAGEFRFEGISQTFTRKLYEWEEMKGIGPEVSTIALLDSNKPSDGKGGHPLMTKMSKKPLHTLAPPALKFGRMDRNRSRSESSIADIVNVQTSTTSLAPDDLVDDVFADDSAQSRANSEPDIVFNIDEPPCAVEVEEMHIEESIPCTEIPAVHIEEPVYSYTPSEVAYLNDNNDRNIVPTTKGDDTKVVKDATPHDEGNYGQLLDEDIKLLESLTAKEEICRQLENDLEDLDGRMKRMYQQQAEEIRLSNCQSAMTSTSPLGSPVDHARQKQLIEELRARIQELEKTLDTLRTEREVLEATFKINSEQQIQLTQHLAARIAEMQQTCTSEIQGFVKSHSGKLSGHSRKKEGVVKVQELSAELLQQAKTLEQALTERNATIRQLQWELLQRDMSAMQLQEELRKVKEKKEDLIGGQDQKRKNSHNRSWSSMEATSAAGNKQHEKNKNDENKPLEDIQRYSENLDFTMCPQELTRKIRELKTEVMRLWSSTESTTSASSDHGTDDRGIWKQNDISNKIQNGRHAVPSHLISESSCTKQPVDNGQLAGSHNDIDVSLTNIYKDGLQDKMRNSEVSKVNHSPLKTYERTTTVIARRMSDTAMVPTTIKSTDSNTSEILENHHKIQPSRLPRSPDLSKITSLRKGRAEEDLKKVTTTNKTHSKGVSRIAYPQSFQKESSHLTKCSSLDTSKCQDNQDDAKSTSVTSNDVLTQKSPPLYKTFRGQYGTINASPNNSPKFNSQGSFRTQPKCETIKSEEMEEVLSPSPQETRKQEGPCPAAVVLPRRVSPKVDNFLSKKSSSSKSKQNALLKRQNAEDLGSSSDTDTEGSGITFTINLKKKEGELKSKTTSKTRSDSLTTNGATKSTNNANVKSNDSAKVRPACTSPPTSRVILESKLSPKSSPQSPSNVPWRKANHQRDVTNDVASATENAKPGGVTSTSYIPTFSGICRTGNEVLGANSPTIYRKQPDSKALTNDQIPSPETPIVKSRSTRKLKLPAAGRVNEVTGTSPEIKGVPQVETPPAQRSVVRPLKNTAAPNVKLMIEKFNKKVTEEQSSPSLLRSPKLGVNRIRSPIGVQKSTSFTDPSPSSPPITSAESVIKSASASTIESRTRLMGSSLHSPSQTPEMPFKRTPNSSTGQPVGIASRIPRCLKSISEQESGDITKNDSTIFVKQPMTPSSEVVAQDSFNRASVWTSSNDSIRQSPTVAIRAQQIRRAKEEFLFTKIPVSSPAPCADNPSSSSSCSSPTPGWRPQSHRIPSSPLMAEPQLKRNATDVTPSECAKPKSILKVTNKEASSTAKLEPIPTETTDTTTKIMKSASAGAVDDPTTLKLSDLSSDHGSQSSVTSITQQTSQKSGIFNFKFRKAKMKQKKESLNTVKALCRQSLFVDIQPETDYVEQAKPSMMAPTTARSCPSSPELQGRPNGKTGWLAKPRILFKLK